MNSIGWEVWLVYGYASTTMGLGYSRGKLSYPWGQPYCIKAFQMPILLNSALPLLHQHTSILLYKSFNQLNESNIQPFQSSDRIYFTKKKPTMRLTALILGLMVGMTVGVSIDTLKSLEGRVSDSIVYLHTIYNGRWLTRCRMMKIGCMWPYMFYIHRFPQWQIADKAPDGGIGGRQSHTLYSRVL